MEVVLNLYFVVYSVHTDKNEWYGYHAYVFARDENAAVNYVIKAYKQLVSIRSIEKLEYEEGTILKRG